MVMVLPFLAKSFHPLTPTLYKGLLVTLLLANICFLGLLLTNDHNLVA